MNGKTPQSRQEQISEESESFRNSLIRRAGESDDTGALPHQEGASFFFEISAVWEVRILKDDPAIRKVYSVFGLEDAFHDPTVRTILIPKDSSVTRTVAARVCRRHGHGKTVFFETQGA